MTSEEHTTILWNVDVSLHSWHAAEYFCRTEKQHYEEHHIYEKESHGLEQNEGE